MLIETLNLENFKCFKQTEIEFGKITLLTGANSSGKSSLIDALLAVMQTVKFPLYFSPNGKYKNMGGFENISHQNKNESIKIELKFPELYFENGSETNWGSGSWSIQNTWQKSSKSSMPVLNFLKSEFETKKEKIISEIFLKNNKYEINSDYKNQYSGLKKEYTSLEEIGTEILHEALFGFADDKYKVFETVDLQFNYIHSFREEPQRNYYRQAKVTNKITPSGYGFAQQIAEWEETNPEKIQALVKYLKDLKLIHNLHTENRNDGTFRILVKTGEKSIAVPLTDVGYGVSKILPLLVADLQLDFDFYNIESFKNNTKSLLAISEPEIDLHPSVQADFADYFSKQAIDNQKQYIIETHSEYLINRFRLLIARGELQENDIKIYFFENNGVETKTFPIQFKKDGQITGAPENFFKTYTVDIMEIALNTFEN